MKHAFPVFVLAILVVSTGCTVLPAPVVPSIVPSLIPSTVTPTETGTPTATATETAIPTATVTMTPTPELFEDFRAARAFAWSECLGYVAGSSGLSGDWQKMQDMLSPYGNIDWVHDIPGTGKQCAFVSVPERLYFVSETEQVEFVDYRAP